MIGIIPAAGKATRMGGIPKFLLPVPSGKLSHSLFSHLRDLLRASADMVMVATSEANRYLIDDALHGQRVFSVNTETMSETVLACRSQCDSDVRKVEEFLKRDPEYSANDNVLFGMPDTYFEDDQAFVKLSAALDNGADVAVGVFKTRPEQRSKLGMCRVGLAYPVTRSIRDMDLWAFMPVLEVVDKPAETDLTLAWGILAWKPAFWQYIKSEDPHVGYALPRAIAAGLDVRAVTMDGGYWDCGTPDEYFALIRHLTADSVSSGGGRCLSVS